MTTLNDETAGLAKGTCSVCKEPCGAAADMCDACFKAYAVAEKLDGLLGVGSTRSLLQAEDEVSRTFQGWTQRQPGDREGESFFSLMSAVGNYANVRDQVAQARKMAEASHV